MKHRSPQRAKLLTPLRVVWGASLVAALAMSLTVNGTMSSWTSAAITNDANDTKTGAAVILSESHGGNTCVTQGSSNSSTCSAINTYGGTGSSDVLMPGDTAKVVDLTFTNVGGANGLKFSFTPGTCTSTPPAGATSPTNLCSASNELLVGIQCSTGTSFAAGSVIAALSNAETAPNSLVAKTWAGAPALAANSGNAITCRVSRRLHANASVNSQGVTVSQSLSWTLDKA